MLHGIIGAHPFPLIVWRLMAQSVYTLRASLKVYFIHSPRKCSTETAPPHLVDCGKLMDWWQKIDRGGCRLLQRTEGCHWLEVTSRLNTRRRVTISWGLWEGTLLEIHVKHAFFQFFAFLLFELVPFGPKLVRTQRVQHRLRPDFAHFHGAFGNKTFHFLFYLCRLAIKNMLLLELLVAVTAVHPLAKIVLIINPQYASLNICMLSYGQMTWRFKCTGVWQMFHHNFCNTEWHPSWNILHFIINDPNNIFLPFFLLAQKNPCSKCNDTVAW